MKTLLLNAIVLITLLSSCDKKESEAEPAKVSPLIGSWIKLKTETKTSATDWKTDTKTCISDDLEEYQGNGTWTFYDGTSQCSAGSGILKGTWKFAASNTKIIYTYQGYSGNYESTVETLTEATMVLTQSSGDLAKTEYGPPTRKNDKPIH